MPQPLALLGWRPLTTGWQNLYNDRSWPGSCPIRVCGQGSWHSYHEPYGYSPSNKYPTCYLRGDVVIPDGELQGIRLTFVATMALCCMSMAVRLRGTICLWVISVSPPIRHLFTGSRVSHARCLLFTKGRHVLAVEVHNCSAGSSDLFGMLR